MKKRKFLLDSLMALLFIVLMQTCLTGILLHEVLGLALFGLIILHNALNFPWLKAVITHLHTNEVNPKTKLTLAFNMFLLVLTGFVITSGILISQELFPDWNAQDLALWSDLHHLAAYSLVGLCAIHTWWHWNYIKTGITQIKDKLRQFKIGSRAARIFSLVMLTGIIRTLVNTQPGSTSLFASLPANKWTSLPQNTGLTFSAKKDTEDTVLVATSTTTPVSPSLDDYLSKLVCTGCSRRCPLTALRCSRGKTYKDKAISAYEKQYSAQS